MKKFFLWSSEGHIASSDILRDDVQEYAHGNSLFLDDDDNFLISLRGTSQVFKVDSITGDVIWKLGGVSSDFIIDDPLGGPLGQHHVTGWQTATSCYSTMDSTILTLQSTISEGE